MGRFLRHHPEYLMAAFVLALVVGLALARSAGVAITLGPDAPAVVAAAVIDERPWFDLGMEVWDARCYSRHADLAYMTELSWPTAAAPTCPSCCSSASAARS